MKFFRYLFIASSLSGVAAANVSDELLQVMGGAYTLPASSTGHVTLRNKSDKTVNCTVKMKGIISGVDLVSGQSLTAYQDSDPVIGLNLKPDREREIIFKFEAAVLKIRQLWGDPRAVLTALLQSELNYDCQEVQNPGTGNGPREGTYRLVSLHSGKCLNLQVQNLYQDGYSNGTRVFQYDCPINSAEWKNSDWQLKQVDEQQYYLASAYSGKCLDLSVEAGGYNDGDLVQQFDCFAGRSSEQNRNWLFKPTEIPGVYYVISAWSGKCLDVSSSNPATDGFQNRGKVHQWTCNTRPYRNNQLWRLEAVGF